MTQQPSNVTVLGTVYRRSPVRTHKVMFGEDLVETARRYAGHEIRPTTTVCLSEKFVSICQNNVRHATDVHEGLLAKTIVRFVTKHRNDIGYSHPKKMQVAIDIVGRPRIIFAAITGGLTRLLLRRRGDFYRLAGGRISEIDGFNPDAMPPFDQYAMLPPIDPDRVCDEVAAALGCHCYMIDGNNINVEVIGMSHGLAEAGITREVAREIMLDNPMGQSDELTPIFLISQVTGTSD